MGVWVGFPFKTSCSMRALIDVIFRQNWGRNHLHSPLLYQDQESLSSKNPSKKKVAFIDFLAFFFFPSLGNSMILPYDWKLCL